MYNNKKILVAGGTGTIGIPLVKLLCEKGADVSVVSMDPPEYAEKVLGTQVKFQQSDLTQFENCLQATRQQDFVFNLVGLKGSVGIGQSKVASFFFHMMLYQTYLMEAAFRNDISRYLFVSSVCAYPQSSSAKIEDGMWNGLPKQNDRIPGLCKRIGEIQGETYLHEHGWDAVRIVRPSNVFGPFDDFNPATAQVISALIRRALDGENPLIVWGDGSAIRDFIYSEDVIDGMLLALEKAPACTPINLGSGSGVTIRQVAEVVAKHTPVPPRLEWDPSKPSGDPIRLLSMKRAQELIGFKAKTSIDDGIQKTIQWYLENTELAQKRRNLLHGRT